MIDWRTIDTVLLDMDGTLLDLHYDNHFWLDYLPRRIAEHKGIDPDAARAQLHAAIDHHRGTLNWYCLDFWTQALAVDVRPFKEEIQHLIAIRPHVDIFLEQLRQHGKQVLLVTNAHRDSLNLKIARTGIDRWFDALYSSHDFDAPKEDAQFWQRLQAAHHFAPANTLFIDDTVTVLDAARDFGIEHLLCVRQPDSKQPPREIAGYRAIHHFDEILPQPPRR